MTKLTKERLQQYAVDVRMCNINDEIREMARQLLASMEQEPVAWIVHARGGDQLTTDGGYVANAERFAGIHSTPLYAAPQLPQPAVNESAIFDAAIDICRKSDSINEHAWNHGVLAVMSAFRQCLDAAKPQSDDHFDLCAVDGHFWDGDKCELCGDPRAAMLQGAEPANQRDELPSNSFTNSDLEGMAHGDNPQANAYRELLEFRLSATGWIPCSERMPGREKDVQLYMPDSEEQMVGHLERNEEDGWFRYASWRTGVGVYCKPTHWMPLPAAPQQGAE